MAEKVKSPAIRFKGFNGDWEQCKLGENAFFLKGQGYSKKDLVENGFPIILYGRLYTGYETTIRAVDTFVKCNSDSIISRGNEVIVPASGETAEDIARASAVANSGIILGGDLNIIYPEENIDSTFLALSISNGNAQKELSTKAQGKSVVHLRNPDLKNLELYFPNIDEQRKISLYFEKIDNFITLHQRKYDKLQNVKKSMLEKMFPKNESNIPEIRFAGFTDAWEQCKLDDFGKSTGGTSIESEFSKEGKYKVISIGSYSENSRYNDQGIRAALTSKTESRVLNQGDLTMILNDKTATGRIIGRVLLIENSGTYVYNQRTERIEVNNEYYDSNYLFQMLNAPLIRDRIVKQCQGNTQIYVNWSMIKETKYLVPKLKEQKRIGAYFDKLDNLITLHQRKLEKLKNIKKACLDKMFV